MYTPATSSEPCLRNRARGKSDAISVGLGSGALILHTIVLKKALKRNSFFIVTVGASLGARNF